MPSPNPSPPAPDIACGGDAAHGATARAAGPAAAEVPAPAWWPARWTYRDDGAADGVSNMAADLALFDLAAARGQATLRTYAWVRDTVSFGRHEPVRATWDVDAMLSGGLDVVRRPTGGRALLHGADLTYAVAMPLPREVGWRAAYDAVNARLLRALHALGVPATIVTHASALAPDDGACFTAPAVGEIAVGPQKLAGSAVWRGPTAFLQHGSILVHDTQARLAAFRRDRSRAAPVLPLPAAATLERPSADDPLDRATRQHAAAVASIARWRVRGHAALRTAFAQDATVHDRRSHDDGNDEDFVRGAARHRAGLAEPAWLWRR